MDSWKQYKKIPRYEVSEDGKIRNSKTGRILKTAIDDKGYKKVSLHENGRQHTVKVGRMVADTYYDGYDNGLDVTYKDGDRSNCHYTNLEYKTRSANLRRTYENGRKQTHRMRRVRCRETGQEYDSINDCARDMHISRDSINRNVNRRTRHAIGGYHFDPVE